MDLTDLMRPTLEGLILTCRDAADGSLFCVDTRADGRKMCENKDTLLVRTRESEHHIAQFCSSSVTGERLKSSSAMVCPTEADGKNLVETASISAESLESDSVPVSLDDALRNLEHVEIPGGERKSVDHDEISQGM